MGRRARALAEREFDRRRLADRLVDCLKAAAAGAFPADAPAGPRPA
jgi:hypothetical protein